jgi:polysaccharide export outer membrane protein
MRKNTEEVAMLLKLSWVRVAFLTLAAVVAAGPFANGQQQRPDAPAPAALMDGEYRLGPEDIVQVWVWKEPDLSATVVVRPDGKISLPLIGDLEAKGKSAVQLQEEVRKHLETYLSQPVVNVIVKEVNYPKISVLGQVRKPDLYKLRQKITVFDAIAMAGGFTDYAKRDKVTILRNNNSSPPQTIQINLKRLNRDNGQIYVQPFDTVYVE